MKMKHKEIILEALKGYRQSYIDNIHPMDENDETNAIKVNTIDKAIESLEDTKTKESEK